MSYYHFCGLPQSFNELLQSKPCLSAMSSEIQNIFVNKRFPSEALCSVVRADWLHSCDDIPTTRG